MRAIGSEVSLICTVHNVAVVMVEEDGLMSLSGVTYVLRLTKAVLYGIQHVINDSLQKCDIHTCTCTMYIVLRLKHM